MSAYVLLVYFYRNFSFALHSNYWDCRSADIVQYLETEIKNEFSVGIKIVSILTQNAYLIIIAVRIQIRDVYWWLQSEKPGSYDKK